MRAAAGTPMRARILASVLTLLALVLPSTAADLRVFSGGAAQDTLRALAPEFEKRTGHRLIFTFAHVSIIQKKLADGERADAILLPMPLISSTEKSLPLRAEGRSALARVGIAVIVPETAKRPDISTSDAIRRMLLEARAIAVPRPDGLTGSHLMRLMSRLGIADNVRERLRHKAAVENGADQVASGEADVGLYLASEVQGVKGTTLVGLLPQELQSYVVYGVAVPANTDVPDAALAYVRFISDPASAARWKASGFELIEGKS